MSAVTAVEAASLGSNLGAAFTGDDSENEALIPAVGEVVVAPRTGPKVVATPKRKMIRIQLEENDNIPPTGQFFGHNGASFILRPGEQAEVPVELINVLNAAVMSVPQVDPTTRQVLGYRERLRFPYRVIARDL